jgi:DNA polymerase III epsilon subunit family exonuclease
MTETKSHSEASTSPGRRRNSRQRRRRDRNFVGTEFGQETRMHELDIPLEETNFIVFDIETTGGNPERNGITEICAIKYRSEQRGGRFYSLVNPQIPIPPIVRKMTGISNKTVQDAPLIETVMPDFLNFAERGILVSHNTIGDLKFIRHYAKTTSQHHFDNYFLCTHLLVDKLFPQAPDKSLNGLGNFFGITSEGLHRADADAELTLQVFECLKKELIKRGITLLSEAVRFQGDYESAVRLGWGISKASVDRLPDSPGVLQLKDRKGRSTFVSSATSIKREAKRLSQLNQIPRGILRSVVQSQEIGFSATSSHFEALIEESKSIDASKLSLDPAIWHQKNILALNFVHDAKTGGSKITIAPVVEGSIAVFGPVRDRKAGHIFLDELAEKLGFEISRKGMAIPAYAVEPMLAFFRGHFQTWTKEKLGGGIFQRIIRLFRGADANLLALISKLSSVEPPRKLHALHELHGIVVLFDEKADRAFKVIGGSVLGDALELKHRWNEPYPVEEIRPMVRQLSKIKIPAGGMTPLSVADAVRFNSVLWWIFSGSNRREGVFHSAADLQRMISK